MYYCLYFYLYNTVNSSVKKNISYAPDLKLWECLGNVVNTLVMKDTACALSLRCWECLGNQSRKLKSTVGATTNLCGSSGVTA